MKEFIKQATDEDSGLAFVQLYLNVAPECKEIFALFESTGKPNNEKVCFKSLLLVQWPHFYIESAAASDMTQLLLC